jgi:hypothetical protein
MKQLLFVLLAFVGFGVSGQTVMENNPTNVKWFQVSTPNFKVIFPEGFDIQAQRVGSTLEHIRSAEASTMGTAPRKISVILQNRSSVSNGFVSMFPRRSEFYTMPSQNYNFVGSNDWLNLLAAHEYRHIVQYKHATRGFNKLFYYLSGSATLAGMAHVAAPDWFWEGDAVATETAFTPSGRGRIPNFGLVFRTNLLEGRSFNYHKQYLRSYKHNIPNHYVLGYHMVSYLRRKTNDPDIWEKITQRSWSVPFLPFAFSNAIRNKAGVSVTKLYREMANDLTKEWQNQVDALTLNAFETITKRSSSTYTDYFYPQPQTDGSVLVLREGIGDISQFVRIKDGKEKIIFTPGFINDSGMLSSASGLVAWNEYGYDPRWQIRNYSLIKVYDSNNKVRVVVSDNKSRYGSAAFSPDAQFIVTVRSDLNYQHTLLILSYPSGKIVKEFKNPDNSFYSMPRWSDDGKKIVVLKTLPAGKTVSLIDVASAEERELFPIAHENLGHPVLVDHHLFFNSPSSGIDNIYLLDLNTGKRYQVTSAKYGAYNPAISPDKKFIYYNEQTRNGMDVVRIPFDLQQWGEYQPKKLTNTLHDNLIEQEGAQDLFSNIPTGNFPVKRYSKWKHLVNPFSWGPLVGYDLSKVDVGIASQDILSTTSLNAGYTFDLNERTGYYRVGLSYQGLYPIIDLNFTRGKRAVDEELSTLIITGQDTSVVTDQAIFKWDEQTISGGLRLPLITTNSKYASGLTMQNYVGVTRISNFRNGFNNSREFPYIIKDGEVVRTYVPLLEYADHGTLAYNNFNISGYRLLKRSRRDINSKFGQALDLSFYNTPYGGDFEGALISGTAYLFLPGLMKHHSLYGYVAYQETKVSSDLNPNRYLFRNTVPLPRGVNDYVARFRKYFSASVNYALPLWYPDIALGPVLNIQRVRLNLFADYANGQNSVFRGVNDSYLSAGGELKFDLNLMRFLPQFDLGVRYSYGIDPAVTNFELVIGTFNF